MNNQKVLQEMKCKVEYVEATSKGGKPYTALLLTFDRKDKSPVQELHFLSPVNKFKLGLEVDK
jgi:hypothetical protein